MRLQDKVAIITGAASGIGRASAHLFAREGARVVVADIDEIGGRETVAAITAAGGHAFFQRVNVADEEEVRNVVNATVTQWRRIDILFNNAGVVLVKQLVDMSGEEWDHVMSINVKAAFLMTKYALPHLRSGGGGAILNTGSIASFTGQINTPAYSASKGAIALLTKSLALDFGRDAIRVNCICPGITDTPMLREHLGHGAEGEARIHARLSRVPTGKILSPADVARAALYLVSDDSKGITGTLHVVDGGLLAAAEYDIPLQ